MQLVDVREGQTQQEEGDLVCALIEGQTGRLETCWALELFPVSPPHWLAVFGPPCLAAGLGGIIHMISYTCGLDPLATGPADCLLMTWPLPGLSVTPSVQLHLLSLLSRFWTDTLS